MKENDSPDFQLNRIGRISLVVGIVGIVASLVGAIFNIRHFFQSYLFAYVFWLEVALGCLGILMVQYLVGGVWGVIIRRLLEAATRTLPFMALLFVPFIFGMGELYPWTRPEEAAKLEAFKGFYLNTSFFWVRTVIYFAVWIGIAYLLNRWSLEQDRTGDPYLERRLRNLSGPGLVLYVLTATFSLVDWVMTLEPHWYSTIYGLLVVVSEGLVAFAFIIPFVAILASYKPLSEIVEPLHFRDLGNLMFAFVILWAYMAFSQFLVTWSGNLPEEIPWYLHRTSGGWKRVAQFVIIFHFAVPFLLLLTRGTKRNARILSAIAVGIFLVHIVDVFWFVVPAFHVSGFSIYWMSFAALIGIGGVWVTLFIRLLKGRPLLPAHEPQLQEAFDHG